MLKHLFFRIFSRKKLKIHAFMAKIIVKLRTASRVIASTDSPCVGESFCPQGHSPLAVGPENSVWGPIYLTNYGPNLKVLRLRRISSFLRYCVALSEKKRRRERAGRLRQILKSKNLRFLGGIPKRSCMMERNPPSVKLHFHVATREDSFAANRGQAFDNSAYCRGRFFWQTHLKYPSPMLPLRASLLWSTPLPPWLSVKVSHFIRQKILARYPQLFVSANNFSHAITSRALHAIAVVPADLFSMIFEDAHHSRSASVTSQQHLTQRIPTKFPLATQKRHLSPVFSSGIPGPAPQFLTAAKNFVVGLCEFVQDFDLQPNVFCFSHHSSNPKGYLRSTFRTLISHLKLDSGLFASEFDFRRHERELLHLRRGLVFVFKKRRDTLLTIKRRLNEGRFTRPCDRVVEYRSLHSTKLSSFFTTHTYHFTSSKTDCLDLGKHTQDFQGLSSDKTDLEKTGLFSDYSFKRNAFSPIESLSLTLIRRDRVKDISRFGAFLIPFADLFSLPGSSRRNVIQTFLAAPTSLLIPRVRCPVEWNSSTQIKPTACCAYQKYQEPEQLCRFSAFCRPNPMRLNTNIFSSDKGSKKLSLSANSLSFNLPIPQKNHLESEYWRTIKLFDLSFVNSRLFSSRGLGTLPTACLFPLPIS
jgi:hypothetical protein